MQAKSATGSDLLLIDSDPIGTGVERSCYVHPNDSGKAVKISVTRRDLQSKREIRYYRKLARRQDIEYSHLPKFYGTIKTNLGKGFIVDLVRDYDSQVSKPLKWYLENGLPLAELPRNLEPLKQYFLKNRIIFNYDMRMHNLLLQKLSPDDARLVLIDGLGDTVHFQWLNVFPSHIRSKIQRRWKRFIERLYNSDVVRAKNETATPAEQISGIEL